MNYLRTTLATDWPKEISPDEVLVKLLRSFVPEANPGYCDKMHLVKEWYIEFDSDYTPCREIGIDEYSGPVVAGPSNTDCGFWLDTNMKREDFEGEQISKLEFDRKWVQSAAKDPSDQSRPGT